MKQATSSAGSKRSRIGALRCQAYQLIERLRVTVRVVDVTTDETKTGGWEGVQLLVGIEAVVVMLRLFAGVLLPGMVPWWAVIGRQGAIDLTPTSKTTEAGARPPRHMD